MTSLVLRTTTKPMEEIRTKTKTSKTWTDAREVSLKI